MTAAWSARGVDSVGSWEFSWFPPDVLDGSPRVVLAVARYLASQDSVRVTVTGPSLVCDPADPYAVLAVLAAVMPGEFETSDAAPDLTKTWIDDVPVDDSTCFSGRSGDPAPNRRRKSSARRKVRRA